MSPNNLADCLKRPLKLIFLFCLLLGGSYRAFAQPQPVQLLLENHPTASSDPRDMVEIDGMHYFVANDDEIWQTDGTPEGTSRLEFTLPSGGWQQVGGGIRRIRAMSSVDGKLLLFGFDFIVFESDIILGDEPAILDLTSLTMSPLANINQGQWASSQSIQPISIGEKVFFLANDGIHGQEIWVTDGTGEGTNLLVDINPGAVGVSNNIKFLPVGDNLFFFIDNKQFWKTDGTPDGTTLIKDFTPFNAIVGYSDREIHVVSNEVFFIVGSSGYSIWKTDGTPDGTGVVIENLQSSNLRTLNNELLFVQRCNTTQSCLYKVNTMTAELELVATIPIQYLHNISTEVDGSIFFEGGNELWKTDGTEPGTIKIADLEASNSSGYNWNYAFVNNRFLFTFIGNASGHEIWVSDGTTEGTSILRDFNPGLEASRPEFLSSSESFSFISLNDGQKGRELWATQGSPETTISVGDLRTVPESLTIKDAETVGNDLVLYLGRDFDNNQAPNLVNVTDENTLKAIGRNGSYTYLTNYTASLEVLGESIIFKAHEVTNNAIHTNLFLFKDGTLESVAELSISPTNISIANGVAFFSNDEAAYGGELWMSDGTIESVKMIKDIASGTSSGTYEGSGLSVEYVPGTGYFFTANDRIHGPELWKSDLTDEGTSMLKDIRVGPWGSLPSNFYVFKDMLFFLTEKETAVHEIWVTDGTEIGTQRLFDHSNTIGAIEYHTLGDWLYYVIRNNSFFYELWKTDGTSEGTELVETLGQFYIANEDPFIPLNETLIYIKKSEGYGYDYFSLSAESNEQIYHSETGYLGGYTVVDDYLLFWEGDNLLNSTMLGTDGSAEGTTLLYDLTESSGVKRIDNPFNFKSDLVFQGEKDGITSIYRLPILHSSAELEYKGTQQSSGFEVSFDDAVYNQASEIEVITISNTGYIPLKFTGSFKFDLAGANPEDFELDLSSISDKVNPNSSGEIGITFTPKGVGSRSAALLILTNDENAPLIEIVLTGTGTKADPIVSFADLPVKSVVAEPFDLVASVDTDQDISFSSSNPEIASTDGTLVTIHKVGVVTITAYVEATDVYNAASLEQTLTIEGLPQTIIFEAIPEKTYGDAPFDLTASVDTDQEISFSSSNPEVASTEGKTVTIHKAGTVTITASVAATELYNAASKQQSLTINGVEQILTFEPLPEKTYGDAPFELSATASSGLDVTFSSSDAAIASIEGVTVTILKAGSVTITASQAGNDNYSSATATQTLTINKAAQTITFAALPAKTFGDAPFALAASTTSGLAVAYASSDATVAKVDGTTVTLLKPGSAAITASQAGSDNYLAAASVEQSLVVNKAGQTISFEPLATKTYGDPAFELSASSSTGLPITFTSSDPAVIIVEGNSALIAKAGEVTITASQAGNDNYNAASAEQTLTIAKASQTITFDELPTLQSDDEPIELAAEASSGLPVAFQSEDETIATIEGATLTITGSGATSITATQGGDDNYLAAEEITRALVVEEVTGLKNGLAGLLEVFPNPVQELLFIKHNADLKGEFALTSISGEVISNGYLDKAGSTAIRTSNLKDGIYLLTISKDDTKITFRVIKKN
ncbi:MAG: choice-of-anchor D domain-containing protein [Imperialibacter sp.]|uniref:choice-of-anchor D domain-containing protein n=1 Tax=Imperialibacter sp. TaxID=2038411 RepID=UPI0032EBBB36